MHADPQATADAIAREYVARVEQAADLAAQDRDATMMWLRHSLVPAPERQRMAATIMTSSVYAQAALYGLVDCARCGDLGCGWCR